MFINSQNIILYLLIVPLVGILSLLLLPSWNVLLIKQTALLFSGLTFLLSLFLLIFFNLSQSQFQFYLKLNWISILNFDFIVGIDGISLFFVLLTTLLIFLCLLVSWDSIKYNLKLYFITFFILKFFLIGVFCVLDLLLFYIFFESVLIPMYLIIGFWGSRERKIRAAFFFFLYTLLGSVLMLLSILYVYYQIGTTDFEILSTVSFTLKEQKLLWLSFFASFATKVPMVPVHIWLPEAHVEAPTAGSVLLAGLLLKLGGYGFLRFSIPMFPYATEYFTPFMFTLSVIGIVYASLTTLRQVDLKRIIAYSSVAHMNFVMLGLFSLTQQGLEGAIFLMLGHGVVSSALFLIVGVVYDRHHTRLLMYYGGLTQIMPIFSIFFLLFTMGNIAMPGTSNFVGEFLILAGLIHKNTFITILGSTGMVLGAAYSLWLYNRVAFGDLKIQYIKTYVDVNRREFMMFLPLVFLTLYLGIYPEIFLNPMHASVSFIIENNKLY